MLINIKLLGGISVGDKDYTLQAFPRLLVWEIFFFLALIFKLG